MSTIDSFDVVIVNATIVTMNEQRDVFEGWIGVREGRIAAVEAGTFTRDAPDTDARSADAADVAVDDRVIDANGGIVHPGYISAHQHTMDTLGRGAGESFGSFFGWLFGVYYEGVLALTPDDARRAATLAATDMQRAGITTVLDCWGVGDAGSDRARGCLNATLQVARESGLRWIIAPMVSDVLPRGWDEEIAAAEAGAEAGAQEFRGERLTCTTQAALAFAEYALVAEASCKNSAAGEASASRVQVWTSAELPEMASDDLLRGLSELAREYGRGFTTHLCASPAGAENEGVRAVDRLAGLDVFAGQAVGAHLAFTTAGDRETLVHHGVGAAHCATATMMLGGTRSALGELRDAGLAVGLGLDNATLNTTADMVGEMRHGVAFDRVAGSGIRRITAEEILAAATIEGARALRIADRTGSLERGKDADLVIIDRSGFHFEPERSPALAVVTQSRVDDIRLVMAGGLVVHGVEL